MQKFSLRANRVQLAEFKMNVFAADVDAGLPVDVVFTSECWAHVAAHMTPMDEIIARAEDGEWRVHLLVKDCGPNWAEVVPIGEPLILKANDSRETEIGHSGYYVKWAGPTDKFVVMGVDRIPILKGFNSRDLAEQAGIEHVRTIAAGEAASIQRRAG